jgi:hypothetical protein
MDDYRATRRFESRTRSSPSNQGAQPSTGRGIARARPLGSVCRVNILNWDDSGRNAFFLERGNEHVHVVCTRSCHDSSLILFHRNK